MVMPESLKASCNPRKGRKKLGKEKTFHMGKALKILKGEQRTSWSGGGYGSVEANAGENVCFRAI